MTRALVLAAVLLALAVGLYAFIFKQGEAVAAGKAAAAALAAQQQRAKEAEAGLVRMRQAQVLADSLTARLAAVQRTLATTLKERNEALALAATGRTCLRTTVLRVLDGAPGLRVAGLAAAPGSADAARGAPAAAAHAAGPARESASEPEDEQPGREATDTQVAAWMLQAGTLYETCRQRLDALIDFNQGMQARNPAAAPAVP